MTKITEKKKYGHTEIDLALSFTMIKTHVWR